MNLDDSRLKTESFVSTSCPTEKQKDTLTFRKYSQIVSLAKNGESVTTNDALFSQILNRCKSYIIWLAEIFFAQIFLKLQFKKIKLTILSLYIIPFKFFMRFFTHSIEFCQNNDQVTDLCYLLAEDFSAYQDLNSE